MNILASSIKKNWEVVILLIFILIYIFIFSVLSILRHNSFASNFDLGNMDQTVWNTLYGNFFSMSMKEGNISRLATHADFILIILSPLFLIWDNVRILLVSQTIFLALGVIPVFLITRKILKDKKIALILSLIYLINPGLQWINLYDFHGVALSIPFLLFTFFFGLSKKWKLYWLFFFLSIITKEEVALFLALMGLYFGFIFKEWRIGITSFLIGSVWFVLMIFYIIPQFNLSGQHWAFNEWFMQEKNDIDKGNVSNLVKNAQLDFLSVKTLDYFNLLLRQFGYLSLFGFPWLILGLPEFLINISSNHVSMRTIMVHYHSGIIPALIISTIYGLKFIQKFNKSLLLVISLATLIYVGFFNIKNGPMPYSPTCPCRMFQVSIEDKEFEKVLQSLPKNASIAASGEVRPHITHRVNAFNLPTIPHGTDYIAIIDQRRSLKAYDLHNYEAWLLNQLTQDKNYQIIYQKGHFYLFKRT